VSPLGKSGKGLVPWRFFPPTAEGFRIRLDFETGLSDFLVEVMKNLGSVLGSLTLGREGKSTG